MSKLFYLPKQVPIQSSGAPYAFAMLYFYEAGTTTPQAVYSDVGLTTAITQPVTADSAGVFQPIYLDPTTGVDYRVQLKTSADVLIYDIDDYSAGEFSYASNIVYAQTAAELADDVTPVNYEIVNDWSGIIVPDRFVENTTPGTTDMTNAIQQALNVASQTSSKSRCVQLLSHTYLTGKLDWPANNITLRGSGSAFSYNSSAIPRTILKAKTSTTIVLDLVQTGTAEDRTGNHVCDLAIDGNSIAQYGIECAGSNVIERVLVKGCTSAGVSLANFTNSTRIIRCGLNQNSGFGLFVSGVSATTFSVTDSNISLNTLGGVDCQAGVQGRFQTCVIESNDGPAFNIVRDSAHTNLFGYLTIEDCWLEDNGTVSPFFVIVIDSESSGDTSRDPQRILFKGCKISCTSATQKYLNANVCKFVTFDTCTFSGSTEDNALTLASRASYVAFLDCASTLVSGGLTATQLDNAIATGTLCYHSDKDIRRLVGSGSPAASFTNSWANYGSGYSTAKYWFTRDGNVCVEGSIKTGASGTACFTLPAGYRPAAAIEVPCNSNGSHGVIVVGTDGVVTVATGSSTRTSFSFMFQRVSA